MAAARPRPPHLIDPTGGRYQVLPPLVREQAAALRGSISRHGVLLPVVVDADGEVVDGYHRRALAAALGVDCPSVPLPAAFTTEAEKREYALLVNLCRRQTDPMRWGQAFAQLLALRGVARGAGRRPENCATVAQLADELGAAERTAKRRLALADAYQELPQAAQVAVDDAPDPLKELRTRRREARAVARTAAQAALLETAHPLAGARFRLLHGDLSAVEPAAIPDASVDALVTDPPYQRDDLVTCCTGIATLAARVLKPGGHCLVMVGQAHLDAALEALTTAELTYQWCLAYLTPGQSTQVFGRHVKSNWKPILWLTRGCNRWEHVEDVVRSDMNDKRFHRWGQSVGGFAQLVERFTVPGAVVLDPCVGGGTTALAAVGSERLFVGVDRDEVAISRPPRGSPTGRRPSGPPPRPVRDQHR